MDEYRRSLKTCGIAGEQQYIFEKQKEWNDEKFEHHNVFYGQKKHGYSFQFQQ